MNKTTFDALEPQPYKVNVTLEVACDSGNISQTTAALAGYIDGLGITNAQREKLITLVQAQIGAVEKKAHFDGFSLGIDFGRDLAANNVAEQED